MDHRTVAHNLRWWESFDQQSMIALFTLTRSFTDEQGEWEEEETVEVYCHFEICDSCQGRGSYVNPSIDSNGITAEEWERDWDEEEREAYMTGQYDITCEHCQGMRVVPVPNEGTPDEILEAIDELVRDRMDSAREYDAEMRYCYGSDY